MLVAHADWGANAKKRWVAVARSAPGGRWRASAPRLVGRDGPLRHRLHVDQPREPSVLGFDFPIGIPRAYAARAGITDFMAFLRQCGDGDWREFFDVADTADEIRVQRPFYPRTYLPKGAKRRIHLTEALGIEYESLLRRCERAQPGRPAACAVFWTCGGNQVGKGALTGWRLLQAEPQPSFRCWPFDGALHELIETAPTVVAETYPADFGHQLGIGKIGGKRHQPVRQGHAEALHEVAGELRIDIDPDARDHIDSGFGSASSGEDQFDAWIGLLGMVNVLAGRRSPGDPRDDADVQAVEGWILGQSGLV